MKNLIIYCSCLIFLFSCKTEKIINPPEKVIQTSPLKNETCFTGVILSSTKNSVNFKWQPANYTDNYELVVTNLITNEIVSLKSTSTSLVVDLNRNTPYSWFVNSLNKNSIATKSEVWKFYNAGEALTNYAPYPAEIIAPKMNEQLTLGSGSVNLLWSGLDVDNDISNYKIYFGTLATPPLFKTNLVSEGSSIRVTISSNTTYFWKIITTDKQGNSSESGLFQFKVN